MVKNDLRAHLQQSKLLKMQHKEGVVHKKNTEKKITVTIDTTQKPPKTDLRLYLASDTTKPNASKPNAPVLKSQTMFTVQISNLHPTATREDLLVALKPFGTVTDVTMLQQGSALVVFATQKQGEKAIESLHNKVADGLEYSKKKTVKNEL